MSEDTDINPEESLNSGYVLALPALKLMSNWALGASTPIRQRREYGVFRRLLGMVPRLENILMESTNEESMRIAELVNFAP